MAPLMSCGDLPLVEELRRAFFYYLSLEVLDCIVRTVLKKNAYSRYAWKNENYSLKVLVYGLEGNNELGSQGSFLLLLAASAILLCRRVENKIQGFIQTKQHRNPGCPFIYVSKT